MSSILAKLPSSAHIVMISEHGSNGKGIGKLCRHCGLKIEKFPYFSKYTNKTKYYHVECAQKVNLI